MDPRRLGLSSRPWPRARQVPIQVLVDKAFFRRSYDYRRAVLWVHDGGRDCS